jgi:mRNA interferase MazF
MRRGELVVVAVSGDYGKPRPALVIQSDAFDSLPSVTVLLLTSELHDAPLLRITLKPGKGTGLLNASQIMIDKAQTVPRQKIGQCIGRVDVATMCKVDRALAAFLGLI